MSIGVVNPMARSVLEDDEPLILEATAAMLKERGVNAVCRTGRLARVSLPLSG